MLVTDINFTLDQWNQLLKLHGYKTEYTSSGLFVSPCPNCGCGKNTPHFLISEKTRGMVSYNCELTSGTRLVNFFMIQLGLNFLDAKKEMFNYLGIENKTNSRQNINLYKMKLKRIEKERFVKEEQIKESYIMITSEFRKLRKILNSNYIYFKNKNTISEELILLDSKYKQRYYYLESIINEIIMFTKNIISDETINNIYKLLESQNLISKSQKLIEAEEEEKQEMIKRFKKTLTNEIRGI